MYSFPPIGEDTTQFPLTLPLMWSTSSSEHFSFWETWGQAPRPPPQSPPPTAPAQPQEQRGGPAWGQGCSSRRACTCEPLKGAPAKFWSSPSTAKTCKHIPHGPHSPSRHSALSRSTELHPTHKGTDTWLHLPACFWIIVLSVFLPFPPKIVGFTAVCAQSYDKQWFKKILRAKKG